MLEKQRPAELGSSLRAPLNLGAGALLCPKRQLLLTAPSCWAAPTIRGCTEEGRGRLGAGGSFPAPSSPSHPLLKASPERPALLPLPASANRPWALCPALPGFLSGRSSALPKGPLGHFHSGAAIRRLQPASRAGPPLLEGQFGARLAFLSRRGGVSGHFWGVLQLWWPHRHPVNSVRI